MTQTQTQPQPQYQPPPSPPQYYGGYGASPAPAPGARGPALDQSVFLARWLRVWVALLTVVVLVVIVYLFFITNSLASIDDNLEPTERSVRGAGSDVQRLPDQVQSINRSLEGIDPSLKPISGQLDQIINSLSPIDSRLKTTAGSLVDTAAMLRTVTGQANDIRGVVASAQSVGSAGTNLIWQQVGAANGVLAGGVRPDANNIVAGLDRTNQHLSTIP